MCETRGGREGQNTNTKTPSNNNIISRKRKISFRQLAKSPANLKLGEKNDQTMAEEKQINIFKILKDV